MGCIAHAKGLAPACGAFAFKGFITVLVTLRCVIITAKQQQKKN